MNEPNLGVKDPSISARIDAKGSLEPSLPVALVIMSEQINKLLTLYGLF